MSARNFTVNKADRTGVTVGSLSQALSFWEGLLGCKVLYRTHFEISPQLNVTGITDAAMEVALIALPDGNMIELLEYSAPAEREVFRPRACDVGSVHVALDVTGSKALIAEAEKLGCRSAAAEPSRLRRRGDGSSWDGSSWTVVYIFGPNGEAVELLEKLED